MTRLEKVNWFIPEFSFSRDRRTCDTGLDEIRDAGMIEERGERRGKID